MRIWKEERDTLKHSKGEAGEEGLLTDDDAETVEDIEGILEELVEDS